MTVIFQGISKNSHHGCSYEFPYEKIEAEGWEDNDYKYAVKTPSRQHTCSDRY